jgi:hypothetical protein
MKHFKYIHAVPQYAAFSTRKLKDVFMQYGLWANLSLQLRQLEVHVSGCICRVHKTRFCGQFTMLAKTTIRGRNSKHEQRTDPVTTYYNPICPMFLPDIGESPIKASVFSLITIFFDFSNVKLLNEHNWVKISSLYLINSQTSAHYPSTINNAF